MLEKGVGFFLREILYRAYIEVQYYFYRNVYLKTVNPLI